PALDLEDDDPDVGHEDHEVELVVLPLVGEPHVGEQGPLLRSLAAQVRPHLPLGRRLELGILRNRPGTCSAHPASSSPRPSMSAPVNQAAASSRCIRAAQVNDGGTLWRTAPCPPTQFIEGSTMT